MGGFARYRVICAAYSVPWKLIPTAVTSKNPPTPSLPTPTLGSPSHRLGSMCDWLASQGIARLSAHIYPDHTASNAVAAKLGLDPTGKLDDEG
jgi:hypothetical protein